MKDEAKITAEFLWANHHSILGGKSAVTGAPLPYLLHECPAGVQKAHWGLAVAVARVMGTDDPPRPPLVTEEMALGVYRNLDIKMTA